MRNLIIENIKKNIANNSEYRFPREVPKYIYISLNNDNKLCVCMSQNNNTHETITEDNINNDILLDIYTYFIEYNSKCIHDEDCYNTSCF